MHKYVIYIDFKITIINNIIEVIILENKSTFKKQLEIINYIIQNSTEDSPISFTDINNNINKIDSRTLKKIIKDFNDAQDEYRILIKKKKPLLFYLNSDQYHDMNITRLLLDLIYSNNFFSDQTKEAFKETLIQITHRDQRKYLVNKKNILSSNNSVENDFFYGPLENILKAQLINKTINFSYKKKYPNGSYDKKRYNDMVPIDFNCDNNTFYLYCFDQKEDRIKSFRLSFIKEVEITNNDYNLDDKIISNYANIIRNQSYSYNSEHNALLTLAFEEEIYSNVIDKFGSSSNPIKCDDGRYKIEQKCNISNTFYGWIVGFGGKIEIIAPKSEVDNFKMALTNLIK